MFRGLLRTQVVGWPHLGESMKGPVRRAAKRRSGRLESKGIASEVQRLAAVSSTGVVALRDGCVIWANEVIAEMLGCDMDVLVGERFANWLPDGNVKLPDAVGTKLIEVLLRREGGGERTTIFRLAQSENDTDPTIFTVEYISRLRVLEEQMFELGQELHEKSREVETLRERMRCEHADREHLLQVVSHELRTPITFINGYNRLLLSEEVGPLTSEQRRFLEESTKGCHRLSAFVGNLLEASREAQGGEILEIGSGRIEHVLENVAKLFQQMMTDHKVRLLVKAEGSDLTARFDRVRVEQILTNLLTNSLKYVENGGMIELSARVLPTTNGEREFVEISVADNGPGVAPEDRVRIFDPYVQAGEESRAGGLGLGLSICQRLVEAHGGRITAGERPGGGALFAFTLPRTARPPDGIQRDEQTAAKRNDG